MISNFVFVFQQQHVQDGRKESLDGHVTTFSKDLPADGNGGVYALDCEMVTTAKEREVARMALLDFAGDTCYESLVKPSSKVWS